MTLRARNRYGIAVVNEITNRLDCLEILRRVETVVEVNDWHLPVSFHGCVWLEDNTPESEQHQRQSEKTYPGADTIWFATMAKEETTNRTVFAG